MYVFHKSVLTLHIEIFAVESSQLTLYAFADLLLDLATCQSSPGGNCVTSVAAYCLLLMKCNDYSISLN